LSFYPARTLLIAFEVRRNRTLKRGSYLRHSEKADRSTGCLFQTRSADGDSVLALLTRRYKRTRQGQHLSATITLYKCAVAQYAVLEANAKVNGRGPFSHPTPSKPLNQFRCHVKYITTSPKGVDVQNVVGIDSAGTDLRMREKTRFVWIFLLTYLSVCLSVPSSGLQVTVLGRF